MLGCKVTIQHLILLPLLCLQAHGDTSSFGGKKAARWVKNMRPLKLFSEDLLTTGLEASRCELCEES